MEVKRVSGSDNIALAVKNNNGFCPCRPKRKPETKCMCKEFRQQIEKNIAGKCHCGLYEVITD